MPDFNNGDVLTVKSRCGRRRLIVSVSLMLLVGFLSSSLVSYYLARASVREQIVNNALPLTSDNVYSEIQRDLIRPIFISSLMARDTFVRDWIIDGEQRVDKITKYLQEIKASYDTFTCFLVSDATLNYYYFDGVLKTVDPGIDLDKWYFRVRAMEDPYEINVDPDMANKNTMTIFINYKVLDYDGRFLGAAGVGLKVGSLIDLMRDYSQKYNRSIYLAEPDGKIILSSDDGCTDISGIGGMESIRNAVLAKAGGSFEYDRDGRKVFVNSRYIDELHWHLLVEEVEGQGNKRLSHALILNLFICGIITTAVILMVGFTITAYERVRQRQQTQIVDQRNQLEQANHRKSQLLHILCHDLSNPFGVLISSLGSRDGDLGLLDEMMEEITRSLENGMDTIELVRKMRAMEEGKMDLPLASLPLRPMVEESASILKGRLRDKDVSLEINIADEISVWVEKVSFINSLLNNLLTNAIKFSPRNSIVQVNARKTDDGLVEFSVVDHGIGMPDEIRNALFDLKSTTTRSGTDGEEGTGFGMPLVEMFVKAYGGSIKVDSKDIELFPDGHGTKVLITLKS